MNYLALAMLLAVMQASPPVPRKAADTKASTSHTASDDANTDKTPACKTPPVPQSVAPDKNGTKASPVQSEYAQQTVRIVEPSTVSVSRDWIDCIALGLSTVLVLIAGIGTWVAKNSLTLLRNQTAATQRAADAAKLNADYIISAERAWLVHPMWMNKLGNESFQLSLKNIGKTPAEIMVVKLFDKFTEPTETLDKEPNYGDPSRFIRTPMIAPGDEWKDDATSLSQILPGELLSEVKRGRRRFFICGVVEYRDVLNRKELHSTRFCYLYSRTLDAFVPGGPPSYTQYT